MLIGVVLKESLGVGQREESVCGRVAKFERPTVGGEVAACVHQEPK